MNLSGIILALFMQITMHHHTFLNLGDCTHVLMFNRFRSYHHNLVSGETPFDFAHDRPHQLSAQAVSSNFCSRDGRSQKGSCHSALGVEPSRLLGYFANASLFTTYGILVGSPP